MACLDFVTKHFPRLQLGKLMLKGALLIKKNLQTLLHFELKCIEKIMYFVLFLLNKCWGNFYSEQILPGQF